MMPAFHRITLALLTSLMLASCNPQDQGQTQTQTPETEAADSVFLEELTWVEVRDALASGKTTILIPTGGVEQNGPHMALGKHNAILEVTMERVARRLGDTLVAPIVTYVPEKATSTLPAGTCAFQARSRYLPSISPCCSNTRPAASLLTAFETSC